MKCFSSLSFLVSVFPNPNFKLQRWCNRSHLRFQELLQARAHSFSDTGFKSAQSSADTLKNSLNTTILAVPVGSDYNLTSLASPGTPAFSLLNPSNNTQRQSCHSKSVHIFVGYFWRPLSLRFQYKSRVPAPDFALLSHSETE